MESKIFRVKRKDTRKEQKNRENVILNKWSFVMSGDSVLVTTERIFQGQEDI